MLKTIKAVLVNVVFDAKELKIHRDVIMKYNDLDEIFNFFAITAPRRKGKTWLMIIFNL